MTLTRIQIFTSLDNAVANGYLELLTWTPAKVAMDLIMYDADCEGATAVEITPFIQEWQAARKQS